MAQNQRASIAQYVVDDVSVTATQKRDPGTMQVAMLTRENGASYKSILSILRKHPVSGRKQLLEFSGREARTIYRVLDKHLNPDYFDSEAFHAYYDQEGPVIKR